MITLRSLCATLALTSAASFAAEPRAPALTVDGPVDARIVQTVIATHADDVRACFDEYRASHPAPEGTLILHWAVKDDGSVEETCQSEGTTVPMELGRCVSARVARWQFPPAGFGQRTQVEYAFDFPR